MTGDRLNLAQNTINDRFQSEIVDLLKAIESGVALGFQLAMLGWTQEMIGDRLGLAHNTVNDRLQSEIRNCEKAIESALNFKNPADLIGDKEMPTPELLGWTQQEVGALVGLEQNAISVILPENPKSDKLVKELQEEIGAVVGLEHQSISLILQENAKSRKLVKELLDRHGLDW